MTEKEARGRVRSYIVENFLYARPNFAFSDDDSLLRKGVFDSLGVMEVIGFIEDTWKIEIPPDDIVEENFGSVAGIARYVTSKMVPAA
jgi:acyl carrier protein